MNPAISAMFKVSLVEDGCGFTGYMLGLIMYTFAMNQTSPTKPGFLGVASPFFPGILLFRKPSKNQDKHPVFGQSDGY